MLPGSLDRGRPPFASLSASPKRRPQLPSAAAAGAWLAGRSFPDAGRAGARPVSDCIIFPGRRPAHNLWSRTCMHTFALRCLRLAHRADPRRLAGRRVHAQGSRHRDFNSLFVGEELITKRQNRQHCPECLPHAGHWQMVPVPTELTVGDEGSWNTS